MKNVFTVLDLCYSIRHSKNPDPDFDPIWLSVNECIRIYEALCHDNGEPFDEKDIEKELLEMCISFPRTLRVATTVEDQIAYCSLYFIKYPPFRKYNDQMTALIINALTKNLYGSIEKIDPYAVAFAIVSLKSYFRKEAISDLYNIEIFIDDIVTEIRKNKGEII